jgi:hypothetical protein
MTEQNTGPTTVATQGGFWVRDDAPNTPMFTDDAGNDYELNAGGGSASSVSWIYDDTIAAPGDPGANEFRTNTANPSSVVALYLSETDAAGINVDNIFSDFQNNGYLVMRNAADNSQYRVYAITAITDNTTWWRIDVDYIDGAGDVSIPNGAEIQFDFSPSSYVEDGVELSLMSDLLYWEGATNKWEATGTLIRINPNTPPTGGRLQLGTTSGLNTVSPQIMRPVGAADTIMDYIYGNNADNGFYQFYRWSATPDEMGFGIRNTAVNTDVFKFTLDDQILVEADGIFMLGEKAAAAADKAGYGQFWVRNDASQTPMFTDEAGVDYELNAGIADGTTTNASLRWNGSAWVEETQVRIFTGGVLALYANDDVDATETILEWRDSSGNLRGEIGVGNQNSDAVWYSWDPGRSMRVTGRNTGDTESRVFLDGDPDNLTFIQGETTVEMRVNGAIGVQATATDSGLWHTGTEVVRTLASASGGLEVDNDYNGTSQAAFERVLTTSQPDWDSAGAQYTFDTSTTAADPGAGDIRFDSATPASVTNLYVDDQSEARNEIGWLFGELAVGDLIILRVDNDIADWWMGTVSSAPTDNTGWWTVPVTHVASGTLPTAGDRINMSVQFLSQAGSSSLTGPIRVIGDALASDPPGTETINAELQFYDSDESTELGSLGYTSGGTSALVLENLRTSGPVQLRRNDSGVQRTFLNAQGGGALELWAGGSTVSLYTNFSNDLGFRATDGGAASLYHNAILTANTDTKALGGFKVYNTINDAGSVGRRVLTEVDLDIMLAPVYRYSTNTTASDPSTSFYKFNSVTLGSITSMYIDDLSAYNSHDYGPIFDALADGDVLFIRSETDPADWLVMSVTGAATDNTGWWTIPVSYVAGSAPTNSGRTAIQVQWSSQAAGGGPAAGTTTDSTLRWSGSAWVEETDVRISATGQFGIYNGTDNVTFNHDGNDLLITGTATASITFVDTAVRLDDNVELQFGTGNDASIDYDGTDSLIVDLIADDNFKVTEAGVLKFNVNTFSNRIDIHDGFELYVRSPDDGDWIVFDHDGADGHIGVGGATPGSILCDSAMAWESATDTVSANAVTLAIEDGNAFEVDLEPATATVAVTLSGGPPTGRYYACSVKVQQDGATAQTLTWAGGTFRWRDGTAHVMNSTLDGISIYTFETWDGGTTWYASGADYS